MALANTLHILSAVLWVGGMFFAHQCLRPVVAEQLEPPQRLRLWVGVFRRFFPWVWTAVTIILMSGLWMVFSWFQGFKGLPVYGHTMFSLGLLMTGVFLYVFFAPYQRLKAAVSTEDWPTGAKHLARIRQLVGINTILGVITIAVAAGGRFLTL
jgi:uncharacterized membrane protein